MVPFITQNSYLLRWSYSLTESASATGCLVGPVRTRLRVQATRFEDRKKSAQEGADFVLDSSEGYTMDLDLIPSRDCRTD